MADTTSSGVFLSRTFLSSHWSSAGRPANQRTGKAVVDFPQPGSLHRPGKTWSDAGLLLSPRHCRNQPGFLPGPGSPCRPRPSLWETVANLMKEICTKHIACPIIRGIVPETHYTDTQFAAFVKIIFNFLCQGENNNCESAKHFD